MRRKLIAAGILLVLLFGVFPLKPVQAQMAFPSILIKPDGTIDPASTPIQRSGNTYTFLQDIYADGIRIEKPGILIDGAGHTLKGPYNGSQTTWIIGEGPDQPLTNETWSIGIDFLTDQITGVTVQNLQIANFSIGMYVWAPNCTIVGAAITDTIVGMLVSASGITIKGNYLGDSENGVFFGSNGAGNIPADISLYNNTFVNNTQQLGGCICLEYNFTETTHAWDNGAIGNYWSDYTGTDADGDGIGDTPYNIDVLNHDRFPLMTGIAAPTPIPAASPSQNPLSNPQTLTYLSAVVLVVLAVASALYVVKRQKGKKTA
jgi:hypothetical protein